VWTSAKNYSCGSMGLMSSINKVHPLKSIGPKRGRNIFKRWENASLQNRPLSILALKKEPSANSPLTNSSTFAVFRFPIR